MLYWISVYALVALIVAAPFLLLYLAGYVLWWTVGVIRLAGRSVRYTWLVGADLSRFAARGLNRVVLKTTPAASMTRTLKTPVS